MLGVRVDVNEELKFLRKFKKNRGVEGLFGLGVFGFVGNRLDVNKEFKFCENSKKWGGGGRGIGSGGVGLGVRVDVNVELKFFGKFTKKSGGSGGGVRWKVGLVGGSGWM